MKEGRKREEREEGGREERKKREEREEGGREERKRERGMRGRDGGEQEEGGRGRRGREGERERMQGRVQILLPGSGSTEYSASCIGDTLPGITQFHR